MRIATTLPIPAPLSAPLSTTIPAPRSEERATPEPVLRAIAVMREQYFEPLTMSSLAASVFVSPFHFSRVFAKATGVTPGRYLTAIRMFEAKRLLLTTSLTVSDIVCTVGYSSVGTFTSRFSQAVGMSPSQYRSPEVLDQLLAIGPGFQRLPSPQTLWTSGHDRPSHPQRGAGTVEAHLELPAGMRPADVVVGVFDDRVPQRGPIAHVSRLRTTSTTLRLPDVPTGRWTVLAAAAHRDGDGAMALSFGTVRNHVTVREDVRLPVRLRMRPLRPTDPPMAFTLTPPSPAAALTATHHDEVAA